MTFDDLDKGDRIEVLLKDERFLSGRFQEIVREASGRYAIVINCRPTPVLRHRIDYHVPTSEVKRIRKADSQPPESCQGR